MTLLRTYFVITMTLISSMILSAQLHNEVPGEYIIRVQHESSIIRLRSAITDSRSSGNGQILTYHQVMKAPFHLWLVKYNGSGQQEESYIKFLKDNPEVVSVQKNRYLTHRVIPNDPEYSKQWQYRNDGSSGGVAGADMDMERAWDITTGGSSAFGDTIVICVIDDGVNGMHPDIVENIWINHHEIPANGKDDDGNGYIDDYKGWNIVSKNDNVWTGASHGTPVAGIIGASGNNGKGVSGINWRVKLMPVNYGVATEASALSSYEYAFVQRKLYNTSGGKKGAYIVATNASWGVDNLQAEDAPLWCALFDSLGGIGILNCGATTNSSTDVDTNGDMPTTCTSEYLISVTNLTRADIKLNSAGYGRKSVDLGAYGHQVYTVTRNDYGTFGGTSAATPHATGVIGLIYATQCNVFQNLAKSDPAKAALVAKDMILHGVLLNESMKGISTTNGKLNAYRALKNTISLCENCSPPAGIIIQPSELSFAVSWVNDQGTAKVNLRYREVGVNNWTEISNIKNGHVVGGLKTCTEYEVQTGSNCGLLPSPFSYSKYINTTGCCSMPVIKPIESSINSITLNWSGEDATFKVSYKGPADKWIDTLLQDKSFLLKKVPECTAYTFVIKAFCKKYNNESPPTTEFIASTSCGSCSDNPYCPISRKDASQEWIESFTINKITNKSGTSKEGYRDFSGISNIILDAGKTYDFFIKPGYSGSSFSDYFKIYIDLDQNGKWTLDELIFKTESVKDSVKGQIKIPLKATQGLTKLRVIMSYERFDGACDHLDFEYGEVEDYCVFLNNNNLCSNRADIDVLSVDKNKAIILNNYFLQGVRDSIKVHYKVKGSTDWKVASGKDTLVLNNLEECKLYEYRYQINCDSLNSEFSIIDTFRTSCKINTIEDIPTLFSINPNPAHDILNVTSSLHHDNLSYNISSITGQIIVTEQHLKDQNIPLGHLCAGAYILTISTHTGIRYRIKFVKI
jgi:serine protease